jgi:hypothetical protein
MHRLPNENVLNYYAKVIKADGDLEALYLLYKRCLERMSLYLKQGTGDLIHSQHFLWFQKFQSQIKY